MFGIKIHLIHHHTARLEALKENVVTTKYCANNLNFKFNLKDSVTHMTEKRSS